MNKIRVMKMGVKMTSWNREESVADAIDGDTNTESTLIVPTKVREKVRFISPSKLNLNLRQSDQNDVIRRISY
jgi:hypothetical protein